MKHHIGHSRNGVLVYVDLIRSDAAKNIAQQPHLLGLVEELLQHISLRGPTMNIECDMGRIIGYNFVVDTTDKDTVFYAQLTQDDIYSRFVKNGKASQTQYLTVQLRRDESNNAYELCGTWIGRLNPPRPGSANETDESKTYWANHAFILDNQSLQLRTVTKVCPY